MAALQHSSIPLFRKYFYLVKSILHVAKIYICCEGHVWVDITKRHVITCCKKSIEMTGCENAVLQKKSKHTFENTAISLLDLSFICSPKN